MTDAELIEAVRADIKEYERNPTSPYLLWYLDRCARLGFPDPMERKPDTLEAELYDNATEDRMLWDHAKAYIKAHHADGQPFKALAAPYGMKLIVSDARPPKRNALPDFARNRMICHILAKLITVDGMAPDSNPESKNNGAFDIVEAAFEGRSLTADAVKKIWRNRRGDAFHNGMAPLKVPDGWRIHHVMA